MATGQLILTTEVGLVPYCAWDNQRAHAAASTLARRYLDAGIVIDAALWPDSVLYLHDGSPVPRYTEERFAIPQMVLSMALAEREERFCVADNIKQRMAEYPLRPWPRMPTRTTSSDPSVCQSDDPKVRP